MCVCKTFAFKVCSLKLIGAGTQLCQTSKSASRSSFIIDSAFSGSEYFFCLEGRLQIAASLSALEVLKFSSLPNSLDW